MKNTKYGLGQFKKDFGTDDKCLKYLFESLHSSKCSCGGTYSRIKGRKQYQCSKCRFQIAPTAGTVFHKSDTPLSLWFYAIFVFANAKSGISGKELERQLGTTYKTAWRMLKFIREALKQENSRLSGDVEMDAAYFGGRKNAGRDNVNLGKVLKEKTTAIGAVERKGKLRVKTSKNIQALSLGKFIEENIDPKSRLLTDKSNRYEKVARGYDRHAVNHSKGEFLRRDVHINTIESFWSHVKRSMKGTHKVISKKHLQSYLDGFVFHYNNRHNDKKRFFALLDAVVSVEG